jgi:hypothetical protein
MVGLCDENDENRRGSALDQKRLFCSVLFEKLASFFEGEGVSVDLEFVCAGVFRDGDDIADSVAVLAEGLNDEIDIYHG